MPISGWRHNYKRAPPIGWITLSLRLFGLYRSRNEFRRTVISNHELFSELSNADMISTAERLDDEQRLVPLHGESQIGGGLIAKGKRKSKVRESRQLFVSWLVSARTAPVTAHAGCFVS